MSYLKKLGIYGIRSYGDPKSDKLEEISFFKPLTLILGNNGAGKSTIIESLRTITTGSFPPNSQQGKTFIKDPRLVGSNSLESQGTISLIFKAINQKQILVKRLFQVRRDKNDKMSFDSKDATIKVVDKANNREVSVSHKCLEIEKQVPQLLGVSKAVFENVIFCHQDESLWPFGDNTTLKNIFDELFDTKQFTKLQESLSKQQKEIKKEQSDLKIHLQHLKQRYDDSVQTKQKLAKDAEDLYEETIKLEKMREEFNIQKSSMENEENIRQLIDDLNATLNVSVYQKRQIEEKQDEILMNCPSHDFVDESLEALEDGREQLRKSKLQIKERKEDLEMFIEAERKIIEKARADIDTMRFKDKSVNQIYQDLRSLKDKLKDIIQKDIQSEEGVLEEAKLFRSAAEAKLISATNELKLRYKTVSGSVANSEEILEKVITRAISLQEKQKNNSKRVEQLNEEIEALNNSSARVDLNESLENLEAAKNNCESFSSQITSLNDQIAKFKAENETLSAKISIINQQASIRSKQLEYQQLTKQSEEYSNQLNELDEQYTSLNLDPESNPLQHQASCKVAIRDLRLQKSKIETEISRFHGKLEHLIEQTKEHELKIDSITQVFRESNLLSFITNSENNADFGTKYSSIKEEIEGIVFSITEKETCFNLDRSILQYSRDKKKCKFCKHEVTEDLLKNLEKTQTDRMNRAEKELAQLIQTKEQRVAQKKTLKTLKDKYSEYTETRAKLSANSTEISEIKIQILEQEQRLVETDKLLQAEEEIAKKVEEALQIQTTTLKTQRLLFEADRRAQSFVAENPALMDQNNLTIISTAEADFVYQSHKDNLLKIEGLQTQLIKENQKKNQYQMRLQHFSSIKDQNEQKIAEEVTQQQKLITERETIVNENLNFEREISSIQSEGQRIKDEILGLKESQNVIQNSIQTGQTAYDASTILIDEYLPQYIRLFDSYKEAQSNKGNQKQKQLASQIQTLEESITVSEKKKLSYEEELSQAISSLIEQQGYFDYLSKAIEYHQQEVALRQIDNSIALKSKQRDELVAHLNRANQENKRIQQSFHELKAFEDKCRYKNDMMKEEYRTAMLKYDSVEENFCKKQVEFEIKNGIHSDITVYLEELDKTLINYHKEKMQQINKCIADTWRRIYQGKDIKKLEIKAEENEGKGKKQYNYRIVMFVASEKEDEYQEIDMKGRCSAGQKVLASIIIRLALAEAFTMNCGILALDEPTTNLDKQHSNQESNCVISLNPEEDKIPSNQSLLATIKISSIQCNKKLIATISILFTRKMVALKSKEESTRMRF